MFDKIRKCNKCSLCSHQKPLIDEVKKSRVFWVGLSAKISTVEGDKPLSPTTNSGSLICKVESKCADVPMYRTNLVKCAPLNETGKLRYPNREEIELCLPHLSIEMRELAPQIVFLLGSKVIDSVGRHFSIIFEKWDGFNYSYTKHGNTYFVPTHHPSYVYVYKRKMMDDYVNALESMISQLL